MAGHHQWSKVERLTGALDAKRGKLFSQLAKEITLAARTGGGSREGIPCFGADFTFEVAPDNKNRTATGHDSDFFAPRHFAAAGLDSLLEPATGDDVSPDDERHVVATAHAALHAICARLKHASLEAGAMTPAYLPANHITNNEDRLAAQFLHLSHALEGRDQRPPVPANAAPAGETHSSIDG